MAQVIEDARNKVGGAEDIAFQALATALRAHGTGIAEIMQDALKNARKEAQAPLLAELNDARSELQAMTQRCEELETKAELTAELAAKDTELTAELQSHLAHSAEQIAALTKCTNDVCSELITARDALSQRTADCAAFDSRVQTLDAENAQLRQEVQELRNRDAKRKQHMVDMFQNLQAFGDSLALAPELSQEPNPAQRRCTRA